MNDALLKKSLVNTPETTVKVSAELHQKIMRAVRLAEPSGHRSSFNRAIPAWGAAIIATVAIGVFIYLTQTTPVAPFPVQDLVQEPGPAPTRSSAVSLRTLGDSLVAFSKNTPVPEQELRKELERLKSDLERFDFRS